jgi:hypothetical protein
MYRPSSVREACAPSGFSRQLVADLSDEGGSAGRGYLGDEGGDGAHAVGEDHGPHQRHHDEEDALLHTQPGEQSA